MLRRTLDIIIIVRSHFFPDHSLVSLKFQAGQAGGGSPSRRRRARRDAFTQQKFFHKSAFLAQLVEHLFCKQAVTGSSPVEGSI
jgi:hypothetical protein